MQASGIENQAYISVIAVLMDVTELINLIEVAMNARESCPACDSVRQEQCFVVNGYDIKRCLACGTMYVETLPTPEALAAIYTSEGFYELSPDSMQRIAEENQRRMKLIRGIKPTGRFLDIGCAHGLLLDQAKRAGYTTFGIEPTSKNAEVASSKGHDVFNGWLSDFVAKGGEQRFDVIACLDVIEHIDNPKVFLELATSLLAEDGLMVVSTPNYSGLIAKLLGDRDPYMIPPAHLTFLTANGMHFLAAGCGLNKLDFRTFGKLIHSEMDRSIQRYFPKSLHLLSPLIKPAIRFAFWSMNRLKVGLEQEVYLTKISKL